MRKEQRKRMAAYAAMQTPKRRRKPWIIVLAGAVAVAVVAYTGLRGRSPDHSSSVDKAGAASSKLMPWQATPENTPQVDDHHIPAWKVPTPGPVAWTPPPVIEPPNPVETRPPSQNPGGVNGDRPPRKVLGLENAAAARPHGLEPAP